MSAYLVLARKYRPRTFPELVGQEVVTRVLAGALQEGRIGHAYLFCGPRGTGKTTTARILAKCLNCEQGPTPEPCGTCERCVAADAGNEPDIIELDAASHTGVDHIRALRDEVAYAPMRARHKVYIVDEVHMLSKAAFNALLKTLEEPPKHVVFLFATTEPHKVLETILSRCQVLRLDPISEERIAARLAEVFEAEGVRAEEGVVQELARGARGGMRDALSLADKLLALGGEEPTLEDVQRLGGGGGTRAVEELLDAVEQHRRADVLNAIASHPGGEAELVDALLARLRAAVVLAHCGEDTPLVPGSPEERTQARARAERLGPARVELWMQELLRCRERMRGFAGQERVVLEVALLELARPEATWTLAELAARVEDLAQHLTNGEPLPAPAAPRAPAGTAPASAAPAPSPSPRRPEPAARPPREAAPDAPSAAADPKQLWTAALQTLDKSHGAFAELLRRVAHPRLGPDGLEIALTDVPERDARLVEDRRSRAALSRAVEAAAGRAIELRFVAGVAAPAPPERRAATRPADGPAPTPSEPAPRSERPAPTAPPSARAQTERRGPPPKKPAAGTRPKDAFTQEVADLFGGVVEDL